MSTVEESCHTISVLASREEVQGDAGERRPHKYYMMLQIASQVFEGYHVRFFRTYAYGVTAESYRAGPKGFSQVW